MWLGYEDLNLRMARSKPAALPLGDTPVVFTVLWLGSEPQHK